MQLIKTKSLVLVLTALLVGFSSVAANATVKKLPKLLDLGASKCIPCKKMAPILDEMKEEYEGRLDVVFIDVWKPENRAEAKKYNIKAIPTQIFFSADGKELWSHTGYISKADMLSKWSELGFDFDKGQGA